MTPKMQQQEITQFAKAATKGQGNRQQRRKAQAEIKKVMRNGVRRSSG